MPRLAERYSSTPFARVLTAFMWSKTPPWSTTKVAAVLGIARARVSNWVYKDIVPDIETMLVVMARLNIPTSALFQAYAEDGLYVPPLTVEEAQQRQAKGQTEGQTGRQLPPPAATASTQVTPIPTPAPGTTSYAVPHGRYGRQPAGGPANAALQQEQRQEQRQERERREVAEEWENMLAHTRTVMRMAGMPSAAIEALLRVIEDTRDGKPTNAERRVAEEFAVEQPQREPNGEPGQTQPTAPGSR